MRENTTALSRLPPPPLPPRPYSTARLAMDVTSLIVSPPLPPPRRITTVHIISRSIAKLLICLRIHLPPTRPPTALRSRTPRKKVCIYT